jgi:hypothetical protein
MYKADSKALDFIQKTRENYLEIVKPLLDEEDPRAKLEINNILMALELGCGRMLSRYHSGISFWARLETLADSFKKGYPSEELIKEFELDMSQLELSVKSGNTF